MRARAASPSWLGGTKRGRQLLAQLEADMAAAEAFETDVAAHIGGGVESGSGVSSTSS